MISILAFTSVILILRFEFYAIETISEQTGDLVVQTTYGHAEGLPPTTFGIRVKGDFNAAHKKEDERKELSERETAREISRLPCTKLQEKPRFREIVKETLVYSVWFDDRKSQHYIRILLLNSKKDGLPSLSCHFESAGKQNIFTTVASFYEHNENYPRRFGGYIASCIVPKELDSIPCFVNISVTSTKQNEGNSVAFPVDFIGLQRNIDETSDAKYGICTPPVHGDISLERLIEFLELSQILGASHFTFYDFEMTEKMRNVLNYYQNKGLVNVLEWNFPSYIGKNDVHYFGQVLSIMDCLYRSMKHLHFVAFNDLDEFIVPLRHDNISTLLRDIHKDQHCGHCFESVTFDPSKNTADQDSQKASPLLTQRVIFRTSQVTPFWTKCIVDPRRIFEQGIHHISKPNEEYYHADKVDWNIARVFHYRKCRDSHAAMQPRCSEFEVDKTMQKFGHQLMHNFQIIINAIN